MAFAVTLYTFTKRENSTAHPAAGSGATFSCVMKKGCGILSPVIQLDIGLSEDPAKYNFAYIKELGRYYWIDEWINEGPLWSASLRVDPLATWRSYIGNSSLYVLRAAADYDGNIVDSKYPCKALSAVYKDEQDSPWGGVNISIDSGLFVCGIVTTTGQYGSVSYYLFDRIGLQQLCSALMDTTLLEDNDFSLNDASLELQKSLIDPISYIKSCIWLPVPKSSYSLNLELPIPVNGWPVTAKHGFLADNPPYKVYTTSWNIRKHPMTSERGNYVNTAPFTRMTLDYPPFGLIDIDTSLTCDAETIVAEQVIDMINGDAVLRVRVDNNGIIAKVTTRIGVPIQLSQITQDILSAATTTASGAVSLLSMDSLLNPGEAAARALSNVADATKAMAPKLTSMGSNGSFSHLRGKPSLHTQFFTPVNDDPDHNGRPLCRIRRLSSLPGFQMVQDGDIQAPATGPELQSIRQYLEGGYYYE